MPLSLNRSAFQQIGTTVVVSNPDVITISDNKIELYNNLSKHGINIPFTIPAEDFVVSKSIFPLILKQKIGGARSKNVFKIYNESEWHFTVNSIGKDKLNEYIVMEYIEGDEYTCGTVNLNNECKGVIIMKRILRDGDTYKAFTEKNQIIEDHVRLIMNQIKPFGAINIQLRLKEGIPYVFEINARCSGTTAARALSGFNEPKMIADYLLKGIEPSYEIKYHTILRYWKEMIIDNSLVEEINKSHKLINHNPCEL
jgi:carbamoyl-phosphate synthase large subunit